MFELEVPGFKRLRLENIVLDYNGTIAYDGELLPGVADRLRELQQMFSVFVITADTFGTVKTQMEGLASVKVLESGDHREEKRVFVAGLGSDATAAFGNGRNDVGMLTAAAVGIAICQGEGAAGEAIMAADILCRDICEGLDLLRFPKRLLATLRA